MKVIKRILPVVCITMMFLLISQLLFDKVLEREEARCWQELQMNTEALKREITTKFKDEITKMYLTEEIMNEDDVFDVNKIDLLHLKNLQPTTIFSRIDVLYPDGTLISNGTVNETELNMAWDEVVEKGEWVTNRREDFMTGEPCVYYVLPVTKDEEIQAVLVGVINANSLSEVFHPVLYDGQANICIIDAEDGNYIMDSWHAELGNAFNTGDRKKLKGYEDIDLQKDLREMKTGAVAFESRTTGKPLYMYYTPLDMYEWQLAVFAQEDVLFSNVESLRKVFVSAGIVEMLLLLAYFAWNLFMVKKLEKSHAEIETQKMQLEYLSYTDVLTSMHNRHKYAEVWNELCDRIPKSIGVAYIDLNGLKQINDTQDHAAGDRYIAGAANVIMQFFKEESYRIGGDEFVVLAVNMEQESFFEKIEEMKASFLKEQISVSIGFMWSAACCDPNQLMKSAEEKMYENKKDYYLKHGTKR